jgi:hypothetical protein
MISISKEIENQIKNKKGKNVLTAFLCNVAGQWNIGAKIVRAVHASRSGNGS